MFFHFQKLQATVKVDGGYPAGIYLFKVNIKNTGKRCEICSILTIKTPEQRQRLRIYNFECISHLLSSVSIDNFEHVIAGWDISRHLF